jgi:hypothetical protein
VSNGFGFQGGGSGGSTPATINYGLFSQIADSVPIVNTILEKTLVGNGIGTLSVPANTFQVGDTFQLKMGGILNSINNQALTIRLHANGLDIATTGIITLATCTNRVWELLADFTIRQIGNVLVAQLLTNGQFTYLKNASLSLEGATFQNLNNTTFNTTILNTLDVVCQWGTADPLNSIYSSQIILTKVF